MTPKYFYLEDDTAILIAANGTALAALLVNVSDIVTALRLPSPTFQMWFYLCGLVFAFAAKAIIELINGDLRQREKLQYTRDFLIEARSNPALSPELEVQLQNTWNAMEEQHARLLKPEHGPSLDKWRALFYFSSALCFVVGTSTLIVLAGKIAPV